MFCGLPESRHPTRETVGRLHQTACPRHALKANPQKPVRAGTYSDLSRYDMHNLGYRPCETL